MRTLTSGWWIYPEDNLAHRVRFTTGSIITTVWAYDQSGHKMEMTICNRLYRWSVDYASSHKNPVFCQDCLNWTIMEELAQ